MPSGAPDFTGVALNGGSGGPADGIGVFATAMSGGVRLARAVSRRFRRRTAWPSCGGRKSQAPLRKADVRVLAEALRPVGAVLRRVHRNGRRGDENHGEPVSR